MRPSFIITALFGIALLLTGAFVVPQSVHAQCVPPPSDMVAWWPLDETASPANDIAVGVNNLGTWTATPVSVIGKVARALTFNGSNSVTVSDHDELDVGTGDFSIDLWIQTVDSSSVATILDKRTRPGSVPIGYSLFLASGYLGSQIGDGSSFNNCVSTTGFVADGNWHHIAVTVDRNDASGWRHYVDGHVVATPGNPMIALGSFDNAASFVIARNLLTPSQTFVGTLDEIELFKRVLDSVEIQDIWNADSLGKCKGHIEGMKWRDEYPYNCVKDAGELGLSDWTITLSPPGPSGGTCVTNAQGAYSFSYLPAGTYTVAEEPKPGWTQVCPVSPTSYTVNLSQWNSAITGRDFGNDTCHTDSMPVNTGYNHETGSAYSLPGSDGYWGVICNPDGSVDRSNAFVITPYGSWAPAPNNSQWISSIDTARNELNGIYCFEYCFCLEEGFGYAELNLSVRADDIAEVFLNGFSMGTTPAGTCFSFNLPAQMSRNSSQSPNFFQSGVNCIEVRVHNTSNIAMGLNMTGYLKTVDPNFAIISPECCDGIHGVKWHDIDGDCIKDHNEPVMPGWIINLAGTSVGTCVTNANGEYSFGPLMTPGQYTLDETPQPASGWHQVCPTPVPPGSYTVNLAPGDGVVDRYFANDSCTTDSLPVNTGFNHETGSTYTPPGSDAYWGTICIPNHSVDRYPAFVIAPLSGWATAQNNSQWISTQNTANNQLNGIYCFEFCFCLKELYTFAELNLWVRADDMAEIIINGFPLASTVLGTWQPSSSPANISVNSSTYPEYFHSGLNCIEIRVHNTANVAMGLNMTGYVKAYPSNVMTPECCDGIHGVKWYDVNQNCIKESDEPALSGFTIDLSGTSAGTSVTTQGQYFFGPLAPGQYTLSETFGLPGWRQTCPVPVPPGSHNVTLQLGQGVVDRYFANIEVFDTISIITGLPTALTYDNGTGSTGVTSEEDASWGVTCDPTGSNTRYRASIVGTAPGWAAPLPSSQWISSDSSANNKQIGDYCFDYRFCLGDWYNYAELYAELRADDSATVFLNGHQIGATPDSSFMKSATVVAVSTMTNPGYFQSGVNRIEVRVSNKRGTDMGLDLIGYVTADTFAILAPECCNVSCCIDLTGNIDCDAADGVDIGDLTVLIDNLFISFTPLCCEAEANCDGAGGVDIGDLTALIDNLFITFTPPAACQ